MSTAPGFLGGARNRLLPASIPFRFFATACVFHVLAWGLLLAAADEVIGFRGGLGWPLAVLHLLTLGVLVATALGASLQLLPVATGQPVAPVPVLAALWWLTTPEKLSPAALAVVEDGSNELMMSAASALEITVKYAMGKLPLPEAPSVYLPARMRAHDVADLPVNLLHACGVERLPWHHRDPFDRLLVAQAQVESIPIITIDPLIRQYDVQVLW